MKQGFGPSYSNYISYVHGTITTPLKTALYLFLYSGLSLVSQLGPVKSESIKAWSIKSFSLYLFVVT